MNTFQIKVIAIIAMIIDHMGLFLFPQFIIFRLIGRMAFPLFAWLIANGAYHTHNIKKYLLRLFLFALISQIPFMLANRLIDPHFIGLNVFCTLFLGLAAIYFIQKTTTWLQWVIITLFFGTVAQVLQTDYGGFGVAVIVVFYIFFKDFKKLVIAQLLVFFAPFLLAPGYLTGLFEPIGLISLIFIRLYNNQSGLHAKYLFYLFYPTQYLIYYFLLLWLFSLST